MKTTQHIMSEDSIIRGLFVTAASVACALAFAGCKVETVEEGEMPAVDVEVEEGRMPKYDVEAAEVEVESKKVEVEVPTLDVEMPDEPEQREDDGASGN